MMDKLVKPLKTGKKTKRIYSVEFDERLRKLRVDECLSWDVISKRMATCRNILRDRGVALGFGAAIKSGPRQQAAAAVAAFEALDRSPRNDRPDMIGYAALPAGDPHAWAILVAGTWGEGHAYPYAVKSDGYR
jgi:hypothetical protein